MSENRRSQGGGYFLDSHCTVTEIVITVDRREMTAVSERAYNERIA